MHSFRVITSILGLGVLVVSSTSVAAQCYVCDQVVEVTDEYAKCYVENFQSLLDALDTAPGGRHQVNLAGCRVQGDQVGKRGGLLDFGDLPPPENTQAKSIYILDKKSAVCLYRLISEFPDDFDPKAVFDLVAACEDG